MNKRIYLASIPAHRFVACHERRDAPGGVSLAAASPVLEEVEVARQLALQEGLRRWVGGRGRERWVGEGASEEGVRGSGGEGPSELLGA